MRQNLSLQAVGVSLGAAALLFATPIQAVQVWDLSTGSYITPVWSIAPTSPAGDTVIIQDPGNATNFQIRVGVSNFGAAEGDQQTAAIYGAGASLPANGGAGYRIEFSTTVYGWDSYDVVGTPAPGFTGYWDSFAVNVNQTDYYWNLVQTDPVVTPDPAGGCVGSAGVATVTGPACTSGTSILPGETWAWGALDYGNGTFEGNQGRYTLTMTGGSGPYFLSVTLDTLTLPESDTNYPSFGAFNPFTTDDVPPPATVPEPTTLLLVGTGLTGLAGMTWRRARRK